MLQRLWIAAISILAFANAAHSQTLNPPHLIVPRVMRVPVVDDFVSMEAADSVHGMRRVEGFVQRFPNDGEPVSERTVVYVGYDQERLYVAFQCFDRDAQRIGAHVLPRDAFPNDEDTVAVHIDTFRDLKHAYGFQVNALGVQTDGTYTEGAGWDLSWDAVWRAEARLTDKGFVVLYSIPFRSLRFPATDAQQWGMFFYRAIARKNEQVYWPECSTRVAARFPQAAIVDGVEHVSPGRNIQAIPYVAERSFRAIDVAQDGTAAFVSKAADAAVGLDAKVVVHDSIVVDGAINPDFSQVESDQPQITVNKPFEVFFPEKRPFFLENATSFTTPIPLLFTRRIANPLVGGRATGRAGRYALGAIVVDDRATESTIGSRAWFGAARVIRDVGRESSIGVFLSNRSAAGRDAVGAVDARVKLGPNWTMTGQAAASDFRPTGSTARSGSALFASLIGSGRRFNYDLTYNDRSPRFRAVDGFIPRVDIRSADQTYSFRARPARGTLQAWGPDLVVNRTWAQDGRPLDWAVTPRFALQWPGTTILDVYYTAARQALRPGEVPGLTRIVDTVVNRAGVDFQSAARSHIIGGGTFFVGDAANLTPPAGEGTPPGRVLDATVTATIRLSRSLMVDVSYLFDRLRDARSSRVVYSNGITRLRIGEQFTRALALRAIVQYTALSVDGRETTLPPNQSVNYDLLLTYLTSPGTAVYVGTNYNLANIDLALIPTRTGLLTSPTLHNTGWQIFTKMSYLIRR